MIKELVKSLYNYFYPEIKELEINKSRDKMLEDYYDNKYISIDATYNGRTAPNSSQIIPIDVRDFFTLHDTKLKQIVDSLKLNGLSDNEKAIKLLQWIIENVAYESDMSHYGINELWAFPYEVLTLNKKGIYSADCEDFSCLLSNLLIISGVPEWKIRVTAGLVHDPKTNKDVGHCFVVMFNSEKEVWNLLDCCFYPNLLPMNSRPDYKDECMYKTIWFSFNPSKIWSATADIRIIDKFQLGKV